MARSLASRLDRLERLAAEVLNQHQGPVYVREGEAVPDDVAPERVVTIKRVFIDPPEQPQEQLPELVGPSPAIERASPPSTRSPGRVRTQGGFGRGFLSMKGGR